MYRWLRAAAITVGIAALLLVVGGLPAVVLTAAGWPAGIWTAPVLVEANGASTRLYEGTEGGYRLVVGIIPARPVVPQTHLSMQVFDAAADADAGETRPLRDTEVRVTVSATGPAGAAGLGPLPALNDNSIVYFEVDVPFDVVGNWQLSVAVASGADGDGDGDNDGGGGAAVFEIPLVVEEPRAGVQWLWVAIALAAIVLVGLWTVLKVSRGGRGEES